MLWENLSFLLVLIEVGRPFSLFVLYRSSGDFYVGKTRLGKKPSSCWEKPSFVACFSSARYLFSTSLREVTAFAVGRC